MRVSTRIVRTGLAAAVAAGLVVSGTSASAAQSEADEVPVQGVAATSHSAACPGTNFYAVRGTGESQSAELGMGSTLYEVYRTLSVLLDSVQGLGAVYPARFINYSGSVAKGVTATVDDLTALATRCRPQGTTFVIGGYSQGAEVVREALTEIDESVLPHATVLLFGDPNFSPEEQFVSRTSRVELTGDFALDGRAPSAAPFDTSRWSLYSYCHGKDVVCAGRGGVTPHVTYISIDAAAAAARATQAYHGTSRPTRYAAPLAQLNGGACHRSSGTPAPGVSTTLSMQWSPAGSTATYRFYRGKEMTPIGTVTLPGGSVDPSYWVSAGAGRQLITVRAETQVAGETIEAQVAQRYVDVPTC